MGRFNINSIRRGVSYYKRNGVKNSIYKALERIERDRDEANYDSTMRSWQIGDKERERQRGSVFENPYKISILVPLYETDEALLTETLESVASQTYGNWELCIADASADDSRRVLIRDFMYKWNTKCRDSFGTIHDKVKYKHLSYNGGISHNTNEALKLASGDYIALLDHDDLIEPNVLYEFMYEVEKRQKSAMASQSEFNKIMVAYTDEDKISMDNMRYFDYHKKPDFNRVLLCTNNYICHFLIVDASLVKGVGGFRKEYDGAQDHDFVLRCTEGLTDDAILHIPKVLYHWRSTQGSTAENPNAKLYAYEAGKRAIADYLYRQGINAEVSNTPHLGFYQISYDNIDEAVKTVAFDKLSEDIVKEVENSEEEFVLLLSNKLKPITDDYVQKMLNCMNFGKIGVVTGKIIGTDGRVESAGYGRIDNGELIPLFAGLNRHYSGYLHRANLEQFVDGASVDVMLIRKSAIVSIYPDLKLKPDYKIYYYPYAEFKRKY